MIYSLRMSEKNAAITRDENKFVDTFTIAAIAISFLLGFGIGLFAFPKGNTLPTENKTVENVSEGILPPEEASKKAIELIKKFFESQNQEIKVSLLDVKEVSGVYKFVMLMRTKRGEIKQEAYVSRDGKLFFPQALPTNMSFKKPESEESLEIPKAKIPEVKLFVMSYCPFGLQAEKALLPAWKLLKDKANISIHFVYYVMHGKKEFDENLRQYCIQKEQKDKFIAYLTCFVEHGNYSKCISEANIDVESLERCMNETDEAYNLTKNYEDRSTWLRGRYPLFTVDYELNKAYNVRGSPTFVINGKVVRVVRSPEKVKEAICQAFITPPKECEKKLSEKVEAYGFGPLGGGGGSGGGSGDCGG